MTISSPRKLFLAKVPVRSRAFPWSLVHHGSWFLNKTQGKHYSKLSNSVQSLVATNIATGTLGNKTWPWWENTRGHNRHPTKLSVGPKDDFSKTLTKMSFSILDVYPPKIARIKKKKYDHRKALIKAHLLKLGLGVIAYQKQIAVSYTHLTLPTNREV